jgi:hypothetical protein
MQHTGNTKKVRFEAWFRKGHNFSLASYRKRPFLVGGLIVALILLAVLVVVPSGAKSTRSESYKKVAGSAGLQATISYDCNKRPCNNFAFNVYIFNPDGQQVSVIRPDKDGKVSAALSEGKYVMLIGKRFGRDNLFPEEPLVLKNGQELELKLHYREGAL